MPLTGTRADELDEAIAEADRLDPGWTYKDLLEKRKKERPPDDRNSVLQAQRALRLLPGDWLQSRPGDDESPLRSDERPRGARLYTELTNLEPNRRLSEPVAEGLRAELDELAPALAEARRLVDYPSGQTEFTPAKNPMATLLPYAQDARQLVRLLQFDVNRRTQDSRPDEALGSVHAMLNVSRSIGDEPTLISQFVRMAIDGVAGASLQRVLAQGEPSEAVLARLQAELAREATVPRYLYGLRGERALNFDLIGKLATGELTAKDLSGDDTLEPAVRLQPPGDRSRAFYRRNQAVALRFMNRAVEIAKKPFDEQAPFWVQWNADLTALKADRLKALSHSLVLLLLPAVEAAWKADQRVTSVLQSCTAAVACERYRRNEGRWPGELADLVPMYLPAVPTDPYTGKPLYSKRTEDGLLVYGLGEDKADDGGNLSPRGLTTSGFDVGARLFDVAKRSMPASPRP
jgi:hypothetical protein